MQEKVQIAERHLIPKMLADHGLTAEQLTLRPSAVERVVESYTREAGVRNLERKLAALHRGVAVGIVERRWASRVIEGDDVAEFLGPEIFMPDAAERTELPGIATGMAWTAAGGDILFIEASRMPGTGKLRLTGKLGEVMKESAELALTYMRANADTYGVPQSAFKEWDLHLHVPQGATPKDGPSAGVTMFSALASLLTNQRVRGDIAMTGEITLRGMVLPVGGIKDKVLAAHRSGIKQVVLPARNRKDLPDIPEHVQRELKIHFVSRISELLELVLEPASEVPTAPLVEVPPMAAVAEA
jgi:ATP-dependent Lon protease